MLQFNIVEHEQTWPFQEPKLEVPTVYKAYYLGLCRRISPENMAKHRVITYLYFGILQFPLIFHLFLTMLSMRIWMSQNIFKYVTPPSLGAGLGRWNARHRKVLRTRSPFLLGGPSQTPGTGSTRLVGGKLYYWYILYYIL